MTTNEKSVPLQSQMEELYKIIQVQQSTINKLKEELSKKTQGVSRETHEKTLTDLENERYENAKYKMEILEARDKITALLNEIEFLKNELEKERCAYANVFELLKDKAMNESTKSIDLISKIAETEIRYNDALQDIEHKEKKYKQLCGKIKQKEETYEYKVQELNLKLEQDKYINQLLSNRINKTCKK